MSETNKTNQLFLTHLDRTKLSMSKYRYFMYCNENTVKLKIKILILYHRIQRDGESLEAYIVGPEKNGGKQLDKNGNQDNKEPQWLDVQASDMRR